MCYQLYMCTCVGYEYRVYTFKLYLDMSTQCSYDAHTQYTRTSIHMYTMFIHIHVHVTRAVAEEGGLAYFGKAQWCLIIYVCFPPSHLGISVVVHLQWHAGGRGFESHTGHLFFPSSLNVYKCLCLIYMFFG